MHGKDAGAPIGRELRVLPEVGSILAGSLDVDVRLEALADFLVPAIADLCVVDVLEDDAVSRRALRSVDPSAARAIRAIRRLNPGRPPCADPSAVRGGRTTLFSEVDDGVLRRIAESDEHLRLLEELGLVSVIVIPVPGTRGFRGAITLGHSVSGRRFGEGSVAVLEEVGRQVGMAVENALLHRKLEREERRFRWIFEGSEDGIMLVSLDGRILAANPALCDLLGYEPGELRGRGRACIVEEDDPAYRALLSERLRKGRTQGRLELIRKDGERVPVEITSSAVEGREDEEYTVVIVRDVRDRLRQEAELRRREDELQTLLERSPDVVTRYDRDLRATFMSRAIERATGLPPEAFLGRRAGEVASRPALSRRWVDEIERVFETGEPRDMEFTFPTEDGARRFQARIVPEPGPDGEAVGSVLAVSRDITELWNARERARLRARFLDAVGEAVIATDLDGEIIYWNRAAEELYGWSAEEATGRSLADLTPADLLPAEMGEIMDRIRRGEKWAGEVTVRRRDGTEIPVFVTDAPIVSEEGELIGVVGVSQDMTEQKRMEARLRQAQKMQAIGRLAGGVAHDFNNVLTVIRGNTQLALSHLPDGSGIRAELEDVVKAADSATALTRHLLAFSRKQVLEPRVLDPADVVREMRSMLGPLLGERVEIRTRFAEDRGRVEADRGQLEQVVLNLAVNARDAMPRGGVFTLAVESARVDPEVADGYEDVEPGRFTVLVVSDTGVGMSAEVRDQVFEPFFTTKEPGEGTGLGLSTVYGVVRQSGGFVTVESEPGEGTTFRIFLPRVAGDRGAPDPG